MGEDYPNIRIAAKVNGRLSSLMISKNITSGIEGTVGIRDLVSTGGPVCRLVTINYNGEEIKDFGLNSDLGLAKTMYQNCQDGKMLVFTCFKYGN